VKPIAGIVVLALFFVILFNGEEFAYGIQEILYALADRIRNDK
jgi:hypothetical protein